MVLYFLLLKSLRQIHRLNCYFEDLQKAPPTYSFLAPLLEIIFDAGKFQGLSKKETCLRGLEAVRPHGQNVYNCLQRRPPAEINDSNHLMV